MRCKNDTLNLKSSILPISIDLLADSSPILQNTACYLAKDSMDDLKTEQIAPYLPSLMKKLAALIQSDVLETQEMALSALSATIAVIKIEFSPYTQVFCGILGQLILRTDLEMVEVCKRALETLGLIAWAIGEANFAPYLDQGMRATAQMLTSRHHALKGSACTFISDCSSVMKRAVGRYLSILVPLISQIVRESESVYETDQIGHMMGFPKLKQTALKAIGALAEYTEEQFYPHFESTMSMLVDGERGAIISPYQEIRGEVYIIIKQLLFCCGAGNGLNIREKRKISEAFELPSPVYECAKVLMNSYILAIYHDGDVFPVTCACDGVSFVLQSIGPASLQLPASNHPNSSMIDFLKGATLLLFTEHAPCQSSHSAQVDDTETYEKYDDLLDSAGDMVGVLSKVVGTECISFFDDVCNQLILLMEPNKSDRNREMVFRCFCDVINSIGAESVRYVDILIPAILRGLVDPSSAVRRNSAYCTGILTEETGAALAPHYPQLLEFIFPLCDRSQGEDGKVTDNALTAVARMITINPSAVPLSQAILLIISNLPLNEDECEGFPTYSCLLTLAKRYEPTVMGLLNKVIPAFGDVFSRSFADDLATNRVAEDFYQFLNNSEELRDKLMTYLVGLEDENFKRKIQMIIGLPITSERKCCIL